MKDTDRNEITTTKVNNWDDIDFSKFDEDSVFICLTHDDDGNVCGCQQHYYMKWLFK